MLKWATAVKRISSLQGNVQYNLYISNAFECHEFIVCEFSID